MPQTRPFFCHVQHVTGLMAPAPERYPYHDDDQCPTGQQVKESGDWQYYLARPGEERAQCAHCLELRQASPSKPGS